jgi:hypothetical protein
MRVNPFSGPSRMPGDDRPKDDFKKLIDDLKSKRPPKDRRQPPKEVLLPPKFGLPPGMATTMALGEEGPMPIEPGIGDDKPLPIVPVGPPEPAPMPIGVCPPPDVKPGPITWPRPRPDATTMAVGEEGGGPKWDTTTLPGGGVGVKGPFLIDDPAPPRGRPSAAKDASTDE